LTATTIEQPDLFNNNNNNNNNNEKEKMAQKKIKDEQNKTKQIVLRYQRFRSERWLQHIQLPCHFSMRSERHRATQHNMEKKLIKI